MVATSPCPKIIHRIGSVGIWAGNAKLLPLARKIGFKCEIVGIGPIIRETRYEIRSVESRGYNLIRAVRASEYLDRVLIIVLHVDEIRLVGSSDGNVRQHRRGGVVAGEIRGLGLITASQNQGDAGQDNHGTEHRRFKDGGAGNEILVLHCFFSLRLGGGVDGSKASINSSQLSWNEKIVPLGSRRSTAKRETSFFLAMS